MVEYAGLDRRGVLFVELDSFLLFLQILLKILDEVLPVLFAFVVEIVSHGEDYIILYGEDCAPFLCTRCS